MMFKHIYILWNHFIFSWYEISNTL